MTARGTEIVFRCLDCLRVVPERRTTRMVGPQCAPSTDEAVTVVRAICRASDLTTLVEATLHGARHFTAADRVALHFADRACYYQDRAAAVSYVRRSSAELQRLASEPLLIAEVVGPEHGCPSCRLPDARSVSAVPVGGRAPIALLTAYWREPHAARIWHLETMQLLTEAVGRRLDGARGFAADKP